MANDKNNALSDTAKRGRYHLRSPRQDGDLPEGLRDCREL